MAVVKHADLCWGQRYHWLRYQQMPADARHDSHIVVHCPLPDQVSLASVRAVVNHLLRRHEALRTVVDATAAPWPQQVVQAPAPLPVREVTTERDGTPGPAEVIHELTVDDFDLTREWPLRAAVVTTAGTPRRLVLVLHHMAFDDWSLDRFRQEFETMLGAVVAGRRANLAPVPQQPADLARHEAATPPAPASTSYWRDAIAALPADAWAGRRHRPAGTAGSASFTSPTLLTAARRLAQRHRTWPSIVHLAAYAVAAAAYTGTALVPYRWLTSHRDTAPHPTVMTCMFSPTLVTVDLSGEPTFGDVIRRTAARVDAARAHAYVPYDEIVEAFARESTRRGEEVRVASEINFLSHPDRPCGTRRDRFTSNAPPVAWAASGSDAYLQIREWRDGVTVALYASDAVLDSDAVERFLRGYADLITAHLDDAVDLPWHEAVARMGFTAPEGGGISAGVAVPASGSGGPPATAAEKALAAAIEEVNRVAGVDLADSYVTAGGRVLRIPRVLAAVETQGWTGLDPKALMGGQPLGALARTLTRR